MLSYSSSRVLPPKYIHPHIYTHSLLQLRLYKAAHNYLQYTLFLRFCQYALRVRQRKRFHDTRHIANPLKKRFHNAYRIVKPLYHTIYCYVLQYKKIVFPAIVTQFRHLYIVVCHFVKAGISYVLPTYSCDFLSLPHFCLHFANNSL